MLNLKPLASYALPFPFPDGCVWAAIRHGIVQDMVYMRQADESVPYGVFRQQARRQLAKQGVVWSGEVLSGRFVPRFESTDVRHTGALNSARITA